MKRNELQSAFQEEFKNITVSEELKIKTLNNIKNNVYHFPYWIKNCVAVFIVTCLCLSVWFINNKNLFSNKDFTLQEVKIIPNTTEDTQKNLMNASTMRSRDIPEADQSQAKSFSTYDYSDSAEISEENNSLQEDLSSNAIQYSCESFTGNSTTSGESIIGLSEQEFLARYPDAEKTELGYRIFENGIDVLYKLKDGIIYEKENIK